MLRKELVDQVLKFRDERDWKQFHTPKNLAESIVIESSELLEIFQWIESSKSKEKAEENLDKVKDEVADVLVYLTYFCDDLGIDPDEAVAEKMSKNAGKYPAEKAKGNSKKYTEL
jgi:NTP pyrophosphatase (non-canonical NTP hydrolase)